MSERWPGGIISKTAPTPSGPYQNSTAPGIWTLEQQAYWAKQGQWPTAGAINVDGFVENSFQTSLYTGNGPTPYSIETNGTSSWTTSAYDSAFALGSGNWTVECWVYLTAKPAFFPIFAVNASSSSSYGALRVDIHPSGGFYVLIAQGGNIWINTNNFGTANINNWMHLAVVRNGSQITLYVNGGGINCYTVSGAVLNPNGNITGVGYPFNSVAGTMWATNFRVVKGTAVYTSNFTPPTSQLTNISGTSLLTLQSPNLFVDNSSNAFTVTNNSTTTNTQNPFGASGGSGTQTINNGLDLLGKGGLTWIKARSTATQHYLFDTARGALNELNSNNGQGSSSFSGSLTSFNSNGFSLGSNSDTNSNNVTYTSWSFKEQPKFFDIATFTTNGSGGATFSHSPASTPGMIIIKLIGGAESWYVWHRSLGNSQLIFLSSNGAAFSQANWCIPNATTVTLDSIFSPSSAYIAYLFAHDAGGFGASGNENVISCGSYVGSNSSPVEVTLGYEPQFVLIKETTNGFGGSAWCLFDNMRGMPVGSNSATLAANTAGAENAQPLGIAQFIAPTATGFRLTAPGSTATCLGGATYIYMAIRRGPMATPTLGTSVFAPVKGTATTPGFVTGFPVDMGIFKNYPSGGFNQLCSRLQGPRYLTPADTSAEGADSGAVFDYQNGWYGSLPANIYIGWNFRRAPGFFDVVCYTGNGVQNRQVTHNLTVKPELFIVKKRNAAKQGYVYNSINGATGFLRLFTATGGDSAIQISTIPWNDVEPTSTYISLNSDDAVNGSGDTYVAYLFATVAGVSKVGSYTGTGATQTINCGFTTGARFVLIKRTDSTGDWYVWDSARGIVAGNDPYLLLNSTAAEVTNTDYVDTASSGFEISSTAPAAINANGGTFIFLAIA